MIKTRVASSKLNKRDVPLHNTRLFYVGVSIILLNEQSIDFLNNFHLWNFGQFLEPIHSNGNTMTYNIVRLLHDVGRYVHVQVANRETMIKLIF